ncbi:MAG TPA: protein phosphatase 2C domain-containing protein [Chloroflexota bacterium]
MSTYLRPLYYARTDVGRQRDHNEDAVYAGEIPDAAGDSPAYLLAVADGVGGNDRGEWASQTSIDTLKHQVQLELSDATPHDALLAGFRAANATVWEAGAGGHPSQRPASTLVVALVKEGTLWWAHVGDSRAYLVRQVRAQRLTQDHSWIDEQVRAGLLSREQAQISERRHAITRSIGYAADIEVDLGGPLPLRSGDVIVLCSDGLHDQVSDDELAGVVQQLLPEAAADRLVVLSNERGGPDNISVVLCSMFDASADESAYKRHPAEGAVTLP